MGRRRVLSAAERQALRDVLVERTRRFDFPVVADLDFGHTSPQFTLPLGCRAVIDANAQRFEIVEGAVV